MTSFLTRLSGWSEDGVQVPPDMLQRLVAMAKETSLGKKALLQLVGLTVNCIYTFTLTLSLSLSSSPLSHVTHTCALSLSVYLPSPHTLHLFLSLNHSSPNLFSLSLSFFFSFEWLPWLLLSPRSDHS